MDKHVQSKVLNIFKFQLPSCKEEQVVCCLVHMFLELHEVQEQADFLHRTEEFERVEFESNFKFSMGFFLGIP